MVTEKKTIYSSTPTPIAVHAHNGIDSNTLDIIDIIPQQTATTPVSGIAGATYTATEQAMINNLVTAVNSLITKLKNTRITQ